MRTHKPNGIPKCLLSLQRSATWSVWAFNQYFEFFFFLLQQLMCSIFLNVQAQRQSLCCVLPLNLCCSGWIIVSVLINNVVCLLHGYKPACRRERVGICKRMSFTTKISSSVICSEVIDIELSFHYGVKVKGFPVKHYFPALLQCHTIFSNDEWAAKVD